MASISAPKGPAYDRRAAERGRQKDLQTLRNKETWTPVERDNILKMLMDDVISRGASSRPTA